MNESGIDDTGGERRESLRGTIESAKMSERGMVLTVGLENPGDRALHYVSDVRNIQFDPSANVLKIKLSDEGRMLVPGGLARLPSFKTIDPRASQSIEILLPEKIVKLADNPASDELALEEQNIGKAVELEVSIGWADTPFYPDTRETDDQRMPAAIWQQDSLTMRHKMENGRE